MASIDLLAEPALRAPLSGRRVALLAHPASVTADLTHSLDALAACGDLKFTAAFGPQHGLRGDKQDNMIESPDFNDPVHGIPVFSLYGEVRKPTDAMMDAFDVMLVDLQDLGCRIYTFITTLRYVLEAAAKHRKAVWVLDRPNPVGRPVEGLTLRAGWESFVGAGPLPMRHGLTLGELGHWFVKTLKLDVEYRVIEMQGWQPDAAPGFGWPLGERTWINPSPNAPNLWMARAYAGTVMLEGTTLSEGRGTTRPLELFGAPDIDARAVMTEMQPLAPQWLDGCRLRECWFEPTFHKHAGQALPRRADPHGRPRLRSPGVPAMAHPGARLQGDPPLAPGLPAVARFRLRVRARQSRHRCHQRQPAAAGMGRRCVGDAAGPGCAGADRTSRRGRTSASHTCATGAVRSLPRRRSQLRSTRRVLLSESDEIGASAGMSAPRSLSRPRNRAGVSEAARSASSRGSLGQPDRIAHRRGHIQMRARERALFRGQPSVSQLDRSADQFETIQRCSDRRHGIGNQGNPLGALRRKRGPDRNGIDMDPVDDETGRQPVAPPAPRR